VLAAAVFFKIGRTDVAEIKDAHRLLDLLLGTKLAPYLFAIALIAAGQSSTITGTLAGQIVMEGYLQLRINPWMRRLMTRLIAIIPAVIVILINGESNINNLLVLSQVILSLQLGFAIIPLIHFVSDKKTMGVFAIRTHVKILAWLITAILVYLNVRMVIEQAAGYFSGGGSLLWKIVIILGGVLFVLLLVVALVYPLLNKTLKDVSLQVHKGATPLGEIQLPTYQRIAVALDFSQRDQHLIAHAVRQAGEFTRLILIHIVESAPARVLGTESDDFESRKDKEKLDGYVTYLEGKGFIAESKLGFHNRNKEIPRLVMEAKAELLVIGAHGHSGVKDWLYGETIDAVRHRLKIPVLIVSG
jgi:manganese transport protein